MKVKAFLAVAMLAVAATANAQFSNASKSSSVAGAVAKSYSSVYAEYNMGTLSVSDDGVSASQSGWDGFGVGYNMGTNIMDGMPVYIEYGAAFNYTSKSEKVNGEKVSNNLGTIKVPVNVAYRFTLPNGKLSITPYAGLNAKFHIWGNSKESDNDESVSVSFFEGDDAAKRFQIGFQIGANVDFGPAYVGIGYTKDLTGFYSEDDYKWVFGTTSIRVGYNF